MLPFLLLLWAATESPTQLLQRGLLALQQGDLAQARGAFEQVAKRDPKNAFAWASLAETYTRLKQPASATSAADKAERYGGDNPAIDHALAIYFTRIDDFHRAAELEQKFVASGHADPEGAQRVANLFLEAGDVPAALDAAQKALAQNPSPAAENVLGRALIAAGNGSDGEKHLASAWRLAPTDSRVAFDYAQALLRKQDFDQAAEAIAGALQSHADDPQLVLGFGVARYGQRRFDDAIASFLKVIRIDPQIEQPYVFLGKMLDQAGPHLPEISAACEKWSVRNPKNALALLILAKIRLANDPKDASAEGLLRRSIGINGGNWEAHYELGVLLEGKRDWPGAAVELKRSAELDSRQAMPHYHLARVYDRLGNQAGANSERELHEKLIASPNGPK